LVMDAVICGPDKPYLSALVWLNTIDNETARMALAKKLAAFNGKRQGGASTVTRLLVMDVPLSPEAGEVTDKRSINQRRVMERRPGEVATLYSDPVESRVILPSK